MSLVLNSIIFLTLQHQSDLLIWKVHHLTTSSSFSFVQVEAPSESHERIPPLQEAGEHFVSLLV